MLLIDRLQANSKGYFHLCGRHKFWLDLGERLFFAQLTESALELCELADIDFYEGEGHELKHRDPDQGSGPDYHDSLAVTLGHRDH